MENIIELHNEIFFYLVIISVFVFWFLSTTIYNFDSSKQNINTFLKKLNIAHAPFIETV